MVGNFCYTSAGTHTWDGNVSHNLRQFAKGYNRLSMGVSPENKAQLFPNFPQEECFDLNWNWFTWLSFAFSHTEGPAKQ